MNFHPLIPFVLAVGGVAQAQFSVDTTRLPLGSPFNSSSTENVDFGDVDLDGDWDVALADGGDDGNDQNRLWINQGGLQAGVIGFFQDETAAQCPVVSDNSRDIEFADIDGDGDLDLYTSNTAQDVNQGNRWWVNLGGEQGGSVGFYQDETAARWVGLGGPDSSVPPSILIGGSFTDWSCDCDFGDLDNDGDLDLVHSSYGTAFNGLVPSRIFLNDGDGFYEEFNPAGVQLFLPQIPEGSPGIWCEGVQQSNTIDATGAFCDIATTVLDVEIGDIDGDFDLDILQGARDEAPRMFRNRTEELGGVLGFRDVTGAVFPPAYQAGTGHYEQEFGDLDGDGDLDFYGLNWNTIFFAFMDQTYENDGAGNFVNTTIVVGSDEDDNEVDFLDFDNDGDLDVYVANFSGQDKLFRNDPGGAGFGLVADALPPFGAASLDADACDVDGDGDYDVLVAEDNLEANTLLLNVTEVPDVTPPYVPNVESVGTPVAQAGTLPVRAHVYDNAPYYLTWYNETSLRVIVKGVAIPDLPMTSSQGQVFRGELPANFVGSVKYAVASRDPYGNEGFSATQSYNAAGDDGTLYGSASPGSTLKIGSMSAAFEGSPLYLVGLGAPPGTTCFFGVSLAPIFPSLPVPGISGLVLSIDVSPANLVLAVMGTTDASGNFLLVTPELPPTLAGANLHAQFLALSGVGGDLFMSSRGLRLIVAP